MSAKGVPSGPCYIVNVKSGTFLALDPSGNIGENGTKVQGRTLTGQGSQKWVFESSAASTGYAIKNLASGTYVGFMPGQQADTNIPVTGNQSPQSPAFEILGDVNTGYMLITTYRPTLALTVPNGTAANGTPIAYNNVTWGNPEQRWRILSIPDISG